MTALTLNRRLATLLGWSNIIETGGALLGTPPPGEYCVRNQCRVPDWAGDWRDCGPLIGEHHIHLECPVFRVEARCNHGGWVEVEMGDITRDEATRQAIVSAVIAKLEAACA